MSANEQVKHIGTTITRLRTGLGVTQAMVASKANIDQSRVSRIEKGEIIASGDIEKVLSALKELGSDKVEPYKDFQKREWRNIEQPSFWNPNIACLEIAEEMLEKTKAFLESDQRPWPLRRQIEKHGDSLHRAADFLNKLNHNIAFIGDMGVGKSTAISFIFNLLIPPSEKIATLKRTILETGSGGTTICEVHIKNAPQYGVSILPMAESELIHLVSDFCFIKWSSIKNMQEKNTDTLTISRESERAIRNMCQLNSQKKMVNGKPVYHDPVNELANSCDSEEEFRTSILEKIGVMLRTKRELWYNNSFDKNPLEWIKETFVAINNGRLKDFSLPKIIDINIPNFNENFEELEITVIDTKGIDEVAVREDLDIRLRDSRTAIVFCSKFNDAPGVSTQNLLSHMKDTFSEKLDTGKVSIMVLPRTNEALNMKDDSGYEALSNEEGYSLRVNQIENNLIAKGLRNIPKICFDVESDNPNIVREEILNQIRAVRSSVEERLFDLCAAADEILENHEEQALLASIQEVANRLNNFLKSNRELGVSNNTPYSEAISTIKSIRYASTLWAAVRRNGEYFNLNFYHLLGVGAAKDARVRSDEWFKGLAPFLRSLKEDIELNQSTKTIEQFIETANIAKSNFSDSVMRASIEVYRQPLSQSNVWAKCASEWGQGSGFKQRVVRHIEQWFEVNISLKQELENIVNSLWEKTVIFPLLRLVEEHSPELDKATIIDYIQTNLN